jgi:type II secretory pathway pseudopilin PulG
MTRRHILRRPHQGAPENRGDRGAALIETVVAIALIGIIAAALAAVTGGVLTQSRLASSTVALREIAAAVAETESALGCGLLSGSEPEEVLALAAQRCTTEEMDLVLGDTDRTVTRGVQPYEVRVRYQWVPGDASAPEDPVSCAALAAREPAAILREVTVTAAAEDATTHRIRQAEALPPDAVSFVTGNGALMVSGLPVDEAIDIRATESASTPPAIRRFALAIGETATDTCVWFPYLAPGDYLIGRFPIEDDAPAVITVHAGTTTLHDLDDPGDSP